MRLFFKHIFNSIKRKPLQPILVIFCIAVSVAIFVSTYIVRSEFDKYNRMENVAACGKADIAVRVDSDSMIRYMHLDKALNAVGDKGAVVGMFSMNLLYRDEKIAQAAKRNSVVNVKAVDFASLNSIYNFNKIKFGELTSSNINKSALISQSFASQHKLDLHDKFNLQIGEESIEYEVLGILDDVGLMEGTQILVSFKSVMLKLISAFGIGIDENVKLCNVIYVDCYDKHAIGNMIEILKAEYPDNAVGLSHSSEYIDSLTFIVSIVLYFMSLVFACIGVTIIYSSLTVIMGERSHSSALFMSVGSTRKDIRLMQLGEILFYAIIGGFVGIALSLLPTFVFSKSLGIKEIDFSMSWQAILIGMAFAILVALISQIIMFVRNSRLSLDEMLRGGTKKQRIMPLKWVLALIGLTLMLLIVMFAIPVKARFVPFIFVFLFIILIVSFGLPYAVKGFSLLSEFLMKKTRANGTTIIAFKTVRENLSINNSQRILCILSVLVTVIIYSLVFANTQKTKMMNFMQGDVIVANVSQIFYEKADEVTEAKDYYFANKKDGVSLPNGLSIMILSANKPAKDVVDFAGNVTKVPKGNEIYLTDAVVKSFDKKIGDSIYLTVDSKPKEFKIAGTFDSSMYVGFVDNEYIDAKLEFMVFTAKGDVTDLENELGVIFGTNSTIMMRATDVIKASANLLGKFINLINMLVVFACVFGAVGFMNSYVEHYFSRKAEFKQYFNIGMTKRELACLLIKEAAINFTLAIALGIAIGGALIGLSSVGLLSFGVKFI